MAITNAQLTEATLNGNGLFDLLMRAVGTHLDDQYSKARIKGPEYAEVYLGAMTAILQNSTGFLLERDLKDLERQILEVKLQQALLEKDKLAAEILLVNAQVDLAEAEVTKVNADILRINAQTELTAQQKANLVLEAANIPKIGAKLDAETQLIGQQKTNLIAEALNIPKQGLVLDGQKCKLDAEFDLLVEQKVKTASETGLLNQKKVTEQAQTNGTGIDANSVIGRQISLYQAQADGFKRDAEQKGTKILVDSWNARRATDEATVADGTNKLADAYIGQAVTKLLAGMGA
jgi:hypothetical protein